MASRFDVLREPGERRYVARAQCIGSAAYAALLAALMLFVAHAPAGHGGTDGAVAAAGGMASTTIAAHAAAATGVAGQATATRDRTPGGPSSESETHP